MDSTEHNTVTPPVQAASSSRGWTAALGAMCLVGGISFTASVSSGHADTMWAAVRANFLFFASLSFGAVLFLSASAITGAGWTGVFHRFAAPFAGTFPVWLVCLLVILTGPAPGHGAHGHGDHGLWWHPAFMTLRDVAGLCALALLGHALSRASWRSHDAKRRPVKLAVAYAVFYAVVLSLVVIDLVLSLDPLFVNTLYPAYVFVGGFFCALATLAILSGLDRASGKGAGVEEKKFRDLTNLFLGFGLFTGSLFYSQVLVIWYGNLPYETGFFLERIATPGGKAAVIAVTALGFALPLFTIASRWLKRRTAVVVVVAGCALWAMWLERMLTLLPFAEPGMTWPDPAGVGVTVGFIGLTGLGWLLGRVMVSPKGGTGEAP